MNNNDNKIVKHCNICKTYKCNDYFVRIIKKRDYEIDCDNDGYSYYMKNTIICLECRLILREKNKK